MAVCGCVLLFACQRLFHNFIAAASSQHAGTEGLFLLLFGSHVRDVDREASIGHSPLRVSNASLWTEFPGLWLPGTKSLSSQADGKYLVSLIYLEPAKQES